MINNRANMGEATPVAVTTYAKVLHMGAYTQSLQSYAIHRKAT